MGEKELADMVAEAIAGMNPRTPAYAMLTEMALATRRSSMSVHEADRLADWGALFQKIGQGLSAAAARGYGS